MSRHIIPNAPGSPEGRETTVGWDAPLNTFFAMAFDPPVSGRLDDDEIEVFWHGTMPGEIPSIPALARVLESHGVDLPPEVAASLAEDFSHEGDRSAGRPGSALVAAFAANAGSQAGGGQ